MRKLLMFGLAVIIGLSAGPAMAVQVYTGTTADPGEVLFYDDFEGPTPGGVPDNGAYPGEWATFPGPWGAIIYSDSGDATIQDTNPYDGNGGSQQMRRENLTGSSGAVNGPTVGVFESVVDSGTIHAEIMYSWAPGNNRLTDGFGLAPAEAPAYTGPWDAGVFNIFGWPLHNSLVVSNGVGENVYLFTSFEFDTGDYHKFEIDHTIGTSEYTFTVTDVINDPGNPVSETVDLLIPSTNFGHVVFRQGNDFLSVDWDDAGPMVGDDVPGDFDGDGDVDGDDFLEWQTGFGTIYDGDDFLIWQAAFGGGNGSGAVPEPTSLVLLVLLGLGAAVRRIKNG